MRTEYMETRKIVDIEETFAIPDDGRELFAISYPKENKCCEGEPVLIMRKDGKSALQCACGELLTGWHKSLVMVENTQEYYKDKLITALEALIDD